MVWIKRLFIALYQWALKPEIIDADSAKFSIWSPDKSSGQAKIHLFTFPGCAACEEIRAWLKVEWIPFEEWVVKPVEPPQIIMQRAFRGYRVHKVKNTKTKKVEFLTLYPEFPQMELSGKEGPRTILVGIDKMKEEAMKFLSDNKVAGFAPNKAPDPLIANNPTSASGPMEK